ncbi:hypothetical protein [Streptomyces sp. NPDC005476]
MGSAVVVSAGFGLSYLVQGPRARLVARTATENSREPIRDATPG